MQQYMTVKLKCFWRKRKKNSERVFRILNNEIYNYITAISKNAYIKKLDKKVDKNSKPYHRSIKMRAADVQPKKYVKYDVEYNDKDPKFKVGDRMKISKYKNVFGKGYTPS